MRDSTTIHVTPIEASINDGAEKMTYYQQQVMYLNKSLYAKDHLTKQVICSKRFIDSHFANSITLKEISAACFLSKFHFIRIFKNYYGITPYQYLTDVRIAKAKEYLQNDLTVSETCYSLGFESLSSFSGLFKKITGFTPGEYRHKKATFKK
jgi:AraC-like DNA-binding protein